MRKLACVTAIAAGFAASNARAITTNALLYTTSYDNDTIHEYAWESGGALTLLNTWTPANLDGPGDLKISGDFLYVSSHLNSNVVRVTRSTGAFFDNFVTPSSVPGPGAPPLGARTFIQPSGLVLNTNGELFVTQPRGNTANRGEIDQFGTTGAYLRSTEIDTATTFNFTKGEFGPDNNSDGIGDLYVAYNSQNTGPNGLRVRVFTGGAYTDPSDSELVSTFLKTADGSAEYVISNTVATSLSKFKTELGSALTWVPDQNNDGILDLVVGAYGVDVNSTRSRTGEISLFNGANGRLLSTIRTGGTVDADGFWNTTDLAYGPDGNLWVATYDSSVASTNFILRYSLDGTFLGIVSGTSGLERITSIEFIPEPSVIALLGGGLLLLSSRRRARPW